MFRRIYHIAVRECRLMWSSAIYRSCIFVFPVLVVVFFTTLMRQGVPVDMPVGVVDMDRTSTTRALIRQLDAMQTSRVAGYYRSVAEARKAIQRNEIYAFVYFPEGTTRRLMAGRQPDVSFYYSGVTMLAGSMTYRDMKTTLTLAAASVGATKLAALGKTPLEIKQNLQPVTVDLHLIGNPTANYNIYLSTFATPGVLMIFIFLLVPYAIWSEVKYGRARTWIQMAGGNVFIAMTGKLLPHTLMFLAVFLGFEFYIYCWLAFPHPGGLLPIVLVGVLSVLACQGFGIFIASLIPSLRMSMSVCSIWAVVSMSVCGATFPVEAMSPALQAVSVLFPLRHYIVIYQTAIFGGYPLVYVTVNICALLLFVLLPFYTIRRIKSSVLQSQYIP